MSDISIANEISTNRWLASVHSLEIKVVSGDFLMLAVMEKTPQ